jgi:hypothetical protein
MPGVMTPMGWLRKKRNAKGLFSIMPPARGFITDVATSSRLAVLIRVCIVFLLVWLGTAGVESHATGRTLGKLEILIQLIYQKPNQQRLNSMSDLCHQMESAINLCITPEM